MHLAEFSQNADAPLIRGLVPMSSSRGRLRGSLPICVRCAPPCRKCTLPIATAWTKQMIILLNDFHRECSIRFGNGFCRHIHPLSDLRALLKKARLPMHSARALAPRPALEKHEKIPGEIEGAIANLIRQRTLQEAVGERPETMLIPHIRIKLDIMTAAYQDDLEGAIERLGGQGLSVAAVERRAQEMRDEVAALCYNLSREPRQFIEDHFDEMVKSRTDLRAFEKKVRLEKSIYSIVPALGL